MLPAECIPSTIVNIIIPSTSSITAAPNMVTPSGDDNSFRSSSIRTEIPIDVAVRSDPIKRDGESKNPSLKPNSTGKIQPKLKGKTIPPIATPTAGLKYFKNCFRLVSKPAANNSTIDPICAIAQRVADTGIVECESEETLNKPDPEVNPNVKLAELKSILNPPSIDGPINIPTRSSPKTGGVFRYFATNSPLNFAAIRIVAIWKVNLIRS